MELLTTYTIKSKKSPHIWRFSYDLEGSLVSYEVIEGKFTPELVNYLFHRGKFPHSEEIIKLWQKEQKHIFQTEVNFPTLDFDSFYKPYPKHSTKKQAFDYWNKKMPESERILAIMSVKKYKNYLRLSGFQKPLDPIRYLKHERYKDDFKHD